jgi:hypothetical protein
MFKARRTNGREKTVVAGRLSIHGRGQDRACGGLPAWAAAMPRERSSAAGQPESKRAFPGRHPALTLSPH